MFGIADEQLREERVKQKRSKKDSGSASASKSSASSSGYSGSADLNVEKFGIRILGKFKSAGKGYKADAVIKDTGEKVILVCWQDAIAEISKFMDFNKFIEVYVGKELHIFATRNSFHMKNGTVEEQLVMVKPYVEREGK